MSLKKLYRRWFLAPPEQREIRDFLVQGTPAKVDDLLSRGVNPNYWFEADYHPYDGTGSGSSALSACLQAGKIDNARKLLEAGADPDLGSVMDPYLNWDSGNQWEYYKGTSTPMTSVLDPEWFTDHRDANWSHKLREGLRIEAVEMLLKFGAKVPESSQLIAEISESRPKIANLLSPAMSDYSV